MCGPHGRGFWAARLTGLEYTNTEGRVANYGPHPLSVVVDVQIL